MICDLTGYRGGVYFEAGFAYGLGLEVIYTCRKDWTKEELLADSSGNTVKVSTVFLNGSSDFSMERGLTYHNRTELKSCNSQSF